MLHTRSTLDDGAEGRNRNATREKLGKNHPASKPVLTWQEWKPLAQNMRPAGGSLGLVNARNPFDRSARGLELKKIF